MKYILFLNMLLVTGFVSAQQISKDSLLILMSKDVCKEIEKKDFSKSDKATLQYELGLLMVPTLTKHMDEIEEIYGGSFTDKKSLEKMSIDLAMKLMTTCPKFTELAMEVGMDKQKSPKEEEAIRYTPPKFANASETLEGTLLSINNGDITTISVKDKKGKTEKLYWMEYFENSDYFSVNTKKFLQKKVTVQYSEKEIYDGVKKEYKTIKVIAGLELQ